MSMPKIILVLILILNSILSFAAPVSIAGEAKSFAGKKLVLYKYDDPYTKFPVEIASTFIDSNGNFSISTDIKDIEEVFLRINWITAKMYVKAGSTYSIVFPGFDGNQLISFSKEIFVQPDFVDLPPSDPNLLIAKFNLGYEKFFADHYVEIAKSSNPGSSRFKKSNRNKSQDLMVGNDSLKTNANYKGASFSELVLNFSDSVSSLYSDEDQFVKDYVKYALAQLQLSSGIGRKVIFENHLDNTKLPIFHPEFANFSKSFYYNFFNELEQFRSSSSIRSAIEEYQSIDSLKSALESSDFCNSDELKSLVSILGLKESWYKNRYNKSGIRACLEQLKSAEKSGWEKSLSDNVLQSVNRRRAGTKPVDVDLLDVAGERITWESFNGEITYISFMSSWSSTSLEELALLEKITLNYSRQVNFVVLSLDEDFQNFKDFVSKNHRNKWTFIYGMSDPFIREKLDVWSLPTFILLSPEGKYINGFEKSPSQGVESSFYKLLVEDEKQRKIKVWDD